MTYQEALDAARAEFAATGEPQYIVCHHETGSPSGKIPADQEGYGFCSVVRSELKYKSLTMAHICGWITAKGYSRDFPHNLPLLDEIYPS